MERLGLERRLDCESIKRRLTNCQRLTQTGEMWNYPGSSVENFSRTAHYAETKETTKPIGAFLSIATRPDA
jgi:hypothetical protein